MASNVEESIKSAFRQLVFETPIEKITVSQICERAGIARKTFYVYFGTRDDVLKAIIKEDICDPTENLFPLFSGSNPEISSPFLLERFYQGIYAHQDFYTKLAERSHSHTFVSMLQRCMYELNEALFAGRNVGTMPDKYRYATRFVVAGQASITLQWIRDGFRLTPAKMASYFYEWGMPAIWVVGNPENASATVEYSLK
ncbi:MAG: TetR/AcrR family transcriptional regulator [Eggerthellaceae bacterium]|nr:TetR/AcrR family transcriptional regulator [Eggerthellaceae bacterium]